MKYHFIFDADGTLFDTAFKTSDMTADVARENGCRVFGPEIYHAPYVGHNGRNKLIAIAAERDMTFSDADLDRMDREHDRRKQEFYGPGIQLISGVREMLQAVADAGHLISMGSSNVTPGLNTGLGNAGIAHFFEDRVYGPDRTQRRVKKPEPDIFLKAMEDQKSTPEETVIVEDMNSGIIAASRIAGVLGKKPHVAAYLDPRFGKDGDPKVEEMRASFIHDGADVIVRKYGKDFLKKLPFLKTSPTPVPRGMRP